jgi:hypothetical protein
MECYTYKASLNDILASDINLYSAIRKIEPIKPRQSLALSFIKPNPLVGAVLNNAGGAVDHSSAFTINKRCQVRRKRRLLGLDGNMTNAAGGDQ